MSNPVHKIFVNSEKPLTMEEINQKIKAYDQKIEALTTQITDLNKQNFDLNDYSRLTLADKVIKNILSFGFFWLLFEHRQIERSNKQQNNNRQIQNIQEEIRLIESRKRTLIGENQNLNAANPQQHKQASSNHQKQDQADSQAPSMLSLHDYENRQHPTNSQPILNHPTPLPVNQQESNKANQDKPSFI